jgi:hypothetical protein
MQFKVLCPNLPDKIGMISSCLRTLFHLNLQVCRLSVFYGEG